MEPEKKPAISLCEIFLEYAMFCQTGYEEAEAYALMESFGSGLGQATAIYMLDNIFPDGFPNPGCVPWNAYLRRSR